LRIRSRRLPGGGPISALVVAPHPDDETFGCGGTVALMARRGAVPNIVFITDGGASHPLHTVVSRPEIAARRRAEARVATGILGVNWDRVFFMDAPDGSLARLDGEPLNDIVNRISALLSQVMPEVILLPCRNDGSSEHDAAFAIVRRALDQSGLRPRILEFPVWSRWNPFLLLRHLFEYRTVWRVRLGGAREAKAAAIASYSSQTLPIPPDTASALPAGFASMFLGCDEFFFEW
jgi:LmbE family N-acetylglucosaminyl deacetylase